MSFLLFLIGTLVLLLAGMPVAFAMLVPAVVFTLLDSGSLDVVATSMFSSLNSFILIAIPLFVLAAEVMNASTVTDRLFDAAGVMVGRLRGGLGHVSVLSSVVFAGMSGSEAADVGGIGYVQYKAMERKGYDRGFSAALVSASSCIGPIIPPSIPMIVYGVVANVSIAGLFLGGIIPGALMAIGFMAYVAFVASKHGLPAMDRLGSIREAGKVLGRGFFPMLTPVILLVCIMTGIVTVTEAAMLASVYALGLGVLLYRALSWTSFLEAVMRVVRTCGAILWLFPASAAYGHVLVVNNLPEKFADLVGAFSHSTVVVLIVINVLFLILGMFSSALVNILLFVPVVLPIFNELGLDPIHMGVVITFNVVLGVLTPPLGSGVFFTSAVTKVPATVIFRKVMPMTAILIGILLLMTFVPPIVTFIPNMFS